MIEINRGVGERCESGATVSVAQAEQAADGGDIGFDAGARIGDSNVTTVGRACREGDFVRGQQSGEVPGTRGFAIGGSGGGCIGVGLKHGAQFVGLYRGAGSRSGLCSAHQLQLHPQPAAGTQPQCEGITSVAGGDHEVGAVGVQRERCEADAAQREHLRVGHRDPVCAVAGVVENQALTGVAVDVVIARAAIEHGEGVVGVQVLVARST